jgi:RimJ/RimL family protein N-acetyltransferase
LAGAWAQNIGGRGYASEAARAVLKAGFGQYGLKEIASFTVPKNLKSQAVMKKIGLKYDPQGDFNHPKLPLNHALSSHVLYRITKEEFDILELSL